MKWILRKRGRHATALPKHRQPATAPRTARALPVRFTPGPQVAARTSIVPPVLSTPSPPRAREGASTPSSDPRHACVVAHIARVRERVSCDAGDTGGRALAAATRARCGDSAFVPTSAKVEWHLTYRCNLDCESCSRASFLTKPHTPNMTLDDAYEWMRQADALGWKFLQPDKERARVIIIGGEPTLHPDFLEFVRIAAEWSGTYVQVFSNRSTAKIRAICDEAFALYGASINMFGTKTDGISEAERAIWWPEMYVSPRDAGLPSPPCYVHSSQICGVGVDHAGYFACPIGGSVRALLHRARTKRFADLFDPETAARLTHEECADCGYEYSKRGLPQTTVEAFRAFAVDQEVMHNVRMSATWVAAFEAHGDTRRTYGSKRLPVVR